MFYLQEKELRTLKENTKRDILAERDAKVALFQRHLLYQSDRPFANEPTPFDEQMLEAIDALNAFTINNE